MAKLPVRIELKSELDGLYCRFTVADIPFNVDPAAGDPIEFLYDGWTERVLAIVQYVHHLVGVSPGSVVCCQIACESQDRMVAIFDKFKDIVTVVDPDTGGVRPPSYYPAFRLVYRLWGKKVFTHGVDHPTALAELIRAGIVVGGGKEDLKELNKPIELVHKLIIEHKQRKTSDHVDLMLLMRDWDKETGLCAQLGAADEVVTVEVAKRLFAALKSVPADKLPLCVGRVCVE